MQNRIISGSEARKVILDGVNILANTISATLGPKGKNVIIANEFNQPYITNDGATIARELTLRNTVNNLGVELIKEVALKTNDLAGDGTTTATILASSLLNEGMKYIEKDINPIVLKDNLNELLEQVISLIEKKSVKVTSEEDLINIANISCGDITLARMIATTIYNLGISGHITLEEYKGTKTIVEYNEGYNLTDGYISSYFITNDKTLTTEFNNPLFLVTENLYSISSLDKIIEYIIKENKSLVIILEDIDDYVLSNLITLKQEQDLNLAIIKVSSQSEKNNILDDISVLTNSKYYNKFNSDYTTFEIKDLGNSKKIIITQNNTNIISGSGAVTKKLEQLNLLVEKTELEYEKEIYLNRIAKLNNKLATIKVGGFSDIEIKERKMKIEDALCSTKKALEKGIVLGGGITFFQISNELFFKDELSLNILKQALKSPLIQLLKNSGIRDYDNILNELSQNNTNGFNVLTSKIENFKEKGIVDSTNSLIIAIQSAISICSLLLTTESIIVDETSETKDKYNLNEKLIKDSELGLF